MSYDPGAPSTWSIKHLLEYARQRGIDVPSGCEKSDLIAMVEEYFTDELLVKHIRKENTLDTNTIEDVLGASATSILWHVAEPSYTSILRRHPVKLRAMIETGIEQLQSLSFVARLCSAQIHSPVQEWLKAFSLDCDDSKGLLTTLTLVSSDAAAASSVCGRFCQTKEMVVRCLDCGADSTCVMCMECFRHSPCVNHRYRITQSSGGGMCDCGDPTAWKPESFCSRHRAAAAAREGPSTSDPLDFIMAEEDRAWVIPVLRGVIQFIAITLLQHMRLRAVQSRLKVRPAGQRQAEYKVYFNAAAGSGGRAGGCDATACTSDAEGALLNDVARISAKFDWLATWLSELTQQLWELIQASDVAKRLVAQLWAEPMQMAICSASAAAATGVQGDEEKMSCEANTASPPMTDPVLGALPPKFTCVHVVFFYEASKTATANEALPNITPKTLPWHENLLRCVGHCLSDAKFRFPVGELMATYAEYINAPERDEDTNECLSHYQIQVLTNPDVVSHLMTPAHLPYRAATNTVLHRELSSLLYILWHLRDKVEGSHANPVTETAALSRDGLLFVAHQAPKLSLSSMSALHSCLAVSPAACYTLVLNRLAWRAFSQIAGSLAISGYIYKNPDAPTGSERYATPDFISRVLTQDTGLWMHAIRLVLALLLRMPATAAKHFSDAMPALSPSTITEGLGVSAELWKTWRGATVFDIPLDCQRQTVELMELLSACQVKNGTDEALLLLERGTLAAAQSRAIQRQRLTEHSGWVKHTKAATGEGGEESSANASVMAVPALATAMGYMIQILYEVSRTMDVVLEKQRDGFCRRCRSVVLKRKISSVSLHSGPTGIDGGSSLGEGACESDAPAAEEAVQHRKMAKGNSFTQSPSRQAPQSHLLPLQSTCSVDIFEYALLEPHAHATTFSNYLPRIFGAVLTAWVIEHGRAFSGQQSATSPLPTALTEVPASTRISGLPSAYCSSTAPEEEVLGLFATPPHTNRPLRSLLDAFFHFRAEVKRNTQDRLTFSQQLLDALVMPHVLIGQVFDGLWRRDDYDVSSTVIMYLSYARGVSAEFDILMMQVLTMELAPADMALQILQRFSYAKRSLGGAHVGCASQTSPQPSITRHGQHPGDTCSDNSFHDDRPPTLSARRRFHRRCMNGYRHFLRLVLTIVTDVSKASFQAYMSSPVIDRVVADVLAHGKASHSTILDNVSKAVRSGDYGDVDEDEKDSSGNVIKFTRLVDAAIERLTVAEDSTKGKQFRFKDVDVWRAHVGLYHFGLVDRQLERLHSTYCDLVSATNVARQRGEESHALGLGGKGDDATDGSGQQQQRKPSLPPTQLSDTAMYAELVPTTRALLHTDAVLLPALYVLHEYTNRHRPIVVASDLDTKATSAVAKGSTSSDAVAQESSSSLNDNATHEDGDREGQTSGSESDYDRGSDGSADTNLITREALLHATTALYLCVQDCVSICRAMRASDSDGNDAASAANNGAISWNLVELYLHRFGINESSFTHASCAQWLPLPELVSCRTLLQKLQKPVRLHIDPSQHTPILTCTSTDMLHRLRDYLLSNRDDDPYGCLEMVEAVLIQTGLSTLSPAALLAEQKTRDAVALSRRKLIQERQAMLMQRMRSRALKASERSKAAALASDVEPPRGIAAPAPPPPKGCRAGTDLQGISGPAPSPGEKSFAGGVIGSLVGKLLLELTALDCCVCRSATEEPLYLLCHTSTSDVLPRLGALVLPDGRRVHAHLSMCGHAAHKSCVEKMFVRLSVLWQRWHFKSQFYLGPTEFNCPVCTTITTTLCPMPMLPSGSVNNSNSTSSTFTTASKVPSTSTTVASLFEEIQNGTISDSHSRTAEVAAEFHTTLANAAIGFSPSEDVPAIESTEDRLQQVNEAAWRLSESIRTFCYACHLQLEVVKAGQDIGSRDLIGLLSLLTSIMPAALQRQKAELRSNYGRNVQDRESLLLMDVLLNPRGASGLIGTHLLTQVVPSISMHFVEQLLAAVSNANEGKGDEQGPTAASLEVHFPNMMMTLWRILGVLTLYKLLIVEDAHHGLVLSRSTLTMAGTITLATLNVASVQTPTARSTAIVRMLQYLLPVPHKDTESDMRVVAGDVLACIKEGLKTTSNYCAGYRAGVEQAVMDYVTPEEWVALLSEKLLHLPSVYANVLTRFAEHKQCAICGREPLESVMCCRCGKLMCARPLDSPPELYAHTRTCGGAVGIFLVVRAANFRVLELTSGRLYEYSSNYTDEYGEHDRNLSRGIPLFRNTQETQRLVLTWMLNKWGAQSSIFGTSHRMDLSTL
ncbi:hypothetical protein JKF63_06949 [Porcisia hertigi]|uniref:E3 ubiquitin-protein ligase n=1 Tax=Porcisia hertigi TaxID=2761500 RepID=A0A836LJG3_9TRYP|nr:hypothetical protein JKF63_06949 [Porcisia hertigi]